MKRTMNEQRRELKTYMLRNPPVYTTSNGEVIRWYGANIRCAFWDGYDLMTISPHRGMRGSLTSACYSAGKMYRRLVDKGQRAPLPLDTRRRNTPKG